MMDWLPIGAEEIALERITAGGPRGILDVEACAGLVESRRQMSGLLRRLVDAGWVEAHAEEIAVRVSSTAKGRTELMKIRGNLREIGSTARANAEEITVALDAFSEKAEAEADDVSEPVKDDQIDLGDPS